MTNRTIYDISRNCVISLIPAFFWWRWNTARIVSTPCFPATRALHGSRNASAPLATPAPPARYVFPQEVRPSEFKTNGDVVVSVIITLVTFVVVFVFVCRFTSIILAFSFTISRSFSLSLALLLYWMYRRHVVRACSWWLLSLFEYMLFRDKTTLAVSVVVLFYFLFLDASMHPYKRPAVSVHPSVPWYFQTTKNVISYVSMTTKFDMDQGKV